MRSVFFIAFLILFFLSHHRVIAQVPRDDVPLRIAPRPCEFNNIVLELANSNANGSIIILISRPGIVDRKINISRRRLHTARAYLVEYSKLASPDKVVAAEAPGNAKLYFGGVEIYINGKLHDTLTSMKDKELALGSCSGEEGKDKQSRDRLKLLYPWRY